MKLYIKDSKLDGRYYFFEGDKKSYNKMAKDNGNPGVSYITEKEFTNIFPYPFFTLGLTHKQNGTSITWGAYQEGVGLL